MRFRLFAAFAGLMIVAAAAHAQAGLYIAPDVASISVSQADTGTFAFLGPNNTSRIFKGATMGFYYDFPRSGSTMALGIDIRDRILGSTNGARVNTFFLGLRASYNPHNSSFRPYAEALVGAAGSHSGTNPKWLKRADFGGAVGLDYRLGRHADFRVVEVGFESFQPVSSVSFNGVPGATAPNGRIINANSGLVIRF